MKNTLAFIAAITLTMCSYAELLAPISIELSVNEIHVNKDWTVRQRIESITKVETDRGIAILGEQKIRYNSAHEKVNVIEAYTIQPDGKKIPVPADRIRIQDDDEDVPNGIFSESKLKVIIFPDLKIGSKTHYVAESFQHTPDFANNYSWSHYFTPHSTIRHAEVRFSHDPSIRIRVEGRGLKGGLLAKDSKGDKSVRYVYSFSQKEASPPERGMISSQDFSPHFAASSFQSYAEVAQAYREGALPQSAVTPEIVVHAKKVVGTATSTHEKVKRLYAWVSRNIRYLGVYAGSGGYVPHAAENVLRVKYGDCKDHATLLESLLRAVGVESSQVLINSDRSYKLPEVPGFAVFDHVITYVPELDLFLDSTSRFTPMGLLPIGVVGKPALIVSTGKLTNTPKDDSEKNKTVTRTRMKLLENGSIAGNTIVGQHGYFQLHSRSIVYRNQSKTSEEVVSDMLARYNESGSGSIRHADPLNLDAKWIVESNFILDPVVNLPGAAAFTFPVGLAQGRFQELAGIKSNPKVRFPYLCRSSSHSESIELALPKKVRLTRIPQGVQFESKTLSYRSKYEVKDGTISLTRVFIAKRNGQICGKEDQMEWAEFSRVLQRDLRQQIFLE
jgi:hypothetical protein